jgi:glycopeptide antibiotics resistance protein
VGGNAVFLAALIAEVLVIALFLFTDIPYLWFNFIGCLIVVILAMIFQTTFLKHDKI